MAIAQLWLLGGSVLPPHNHYDGKGAEVKPKKLSLKKETLAELTTDELRGVAAGAVGDVVDTVLQSCYGGCDITQVQKSCYEECIDVPSDPINECPTFNYHCSWS